MELGNSALSDDWNKSYERIENFVFYPSDNAIRFVSKFLRKRISLDEVTDVLAGAKGAKVLDLGCGIGRHINFGLAMGLEMYGIDLSSVAIGVARKWMRSILGEAAGQRIKIGDVRELPWDDGFFDHAISDSAIDSMSFEIALRGISELARVLKPDGYFYCNLIAEDGEDGRLFAGERKATSLHEQGTIQSYFDKGKIDGLFGEKFKLISCELHTTRNLTSETTSGRWHLTLQRI